MHLYRRAFTLVAPLIVVPSLLAAQTYPSDKDARSGLTPGRLDAGTAARNMRLVSFSPKPAVFDTVTARVVLAVAPAASVTVSPRVCEPLPTVVVFQLNVAVAALVVVVKATVPSTVSR